MRQGSDYVVEQTNLFSLCSASREMEVRMSDLNSSKTELLVLNDL